MPDRFTESGYTCKSCSFGVWLPVADLSVATLGLYDDARFPGRSILVLREHAEDFDEIEGSLACAFIGDVRASSRAIRAVTKAVRLNYAILGNREPHLHAHLVPRKSDDAVPTLSPWNHPEARSPLPEGEVVRLVEEIRTALRNMAVPDSLSSLLRPPPPGSTVSGGSE